MSTAYDFDEDFEQKVAALALRDVTFNLRTEGLVLPGYFQNEANGQLVNLAQAYWQRYKALPSNATMVKLLKDAIARKTIRDDMKDDIKEAFRSLLGEDLSDRDYVIDEVGEFARHQAIMGAMEVSIPKLELRAFDEIQKTMMDAFMVGANDGSNGHDALDDLDARTQRRKDIASGKIEKGISSGSKELDDALDGGFKRKELAVLLGPAKRGKSFGLINFAAGAQLDGKDVLFVTLENSVEVTMDRYDAFMSQIATKELTAHLLKADDLVRRRLSMPGVGRLKVHDYGTKTFSPKDLRRLIESYKAKGIVFDVVVVDYWDIMKPSVSYRDDSIRESASIGEELRALAKDENVAMITAIQSNRDGFKAHTATAEHAAEDFNKVRLADVMFSINATDEEKAVGEARIYMAAVRNQEGGYTLNIKQDLAKATFIAGVLGRGAI